MKNPFYRLPNTKNIPTIFKKAVNNAWKKARKKLKSAERIQRELNRLYHEIDRSAS